MNQSVRSLLRGAVLAPVAIAVTVAAAPGGYAVQGPGDEPGRLNFNPSDPSSLFSGEQGADWSTATVRGMLSAARNGAASLQGGVNFRKNRAAAKRRDANGLRPNVQKQSLTVNCQTYNGSARPADAELNGARRRDACVAKGGVGASEDAEPLMPANGRLARSVGKSLWTTADAEPAAGTPGSRQGSRVRTDDRTPTPMAAPPSAGGTLGGGLIGSLLSRLVFEPQQPAAPAGSSAARRPQEAAGLPGATTFGQTRPNVAQPSTPLPRFGQGTGPGGPLSQQQTQDVTGPNGAGADD